MTRAAQRFVRAAAQVLLPAEERQRLSRLHVNDAGHGYDVFGEHADWIALADALLLPLYQYYFRVTSHGSEHIPRTGPVLLVANHAGTLPIDAAMVCLDVLRHTDPPRLPRCIVDHFVQKLPFAGSIFSRLGAVNGTHGNMRHLFEAGDACLVFPEGVSAIGKPLRERYKLQAWHVGHAELALRYHVPVVPVAVIGSEEQWPQIGRIDAIRLFGAPYLPIVATPLPLPVHYHIYYAPPLDLTTDMTPAQTATAPSSENVARAAEMTRVAVAGLLERGLSQRAGVFT
jgi:1-acyl-sn-glycerol-3-phosphate acyltransferase